MKLGTDEGMRSPLPDAVATRGISRRLLALLTLIAGPLTPGPPSTELLLNAAGQNQAFASVGRVRAAFQCTGSLIEPDGAPDRSPALVLTAGHCISLEPYGVILDRAANYSVEFNYFVDTRDRFISVKVKRVVWSTMKGTDLALLELDATLGELRAKGLQGFRIASGEAHQGAPVFWVGGPASNIPQGRAYMRRGVCTLLGTTTVIEGQWLWHDELRIDCQDVFASASGSPLFDRVSGAIAGVIGTSTSLSFTGGPDYDCYRDRPCAVTADGPVVEPDTSYASPAAPLRGCFDDAGRFDLASARCGLDRGAQLAVDIGRWNAAQPVTNGQPARWDARLSGPFQYYAWKHLPLGRGDCRDSAGYSAPVPLATAPVIDAPIGAAEGNYLLCVLAGNAAVIDGSWQPYRNASIRRKRLDAQPPQAMPEYEILRSDLGYRLAFVGSAPAIATQEIKQGPLAVTDCGDRSGYRMMLSVPTTVRSSDFPHRVCVWYADEAGNAAPPLVFDFGPPALQPHGFRNGASLQWTRTVAPGSLLLVDTLEVTSKGSVRLEVMDAAGANHPVPMTRLQPELIEVRVPVSVPAGPARLRVVLPDGSSLSTDLMIATSSPGVFAANFSGFGPALGFFTKPGVGAKTLAVCPERSAYCSYTPVPLGDEDIAVVLYGTGFPRDATLAVGTEEAPVDSVVANRDWPGVDEIRFRLPALFPLRGYQRVQVGTAAAWLLLE